MKKYLLLLYLPLALLYACNTGAAKADEKAELQTQVMAIHDESMAKMGDIFKLRRQLRTMRDTMEAQQAESTDLLVLQQEINSLNEADEVMMQWMRQYEAPDSLQHPQAMAYLQQELDKIKRVRTVMDSTIQAAQTTAQKYEQQK